ncbi:MAG: ATP-binding protein [Candidatus Omnitrophota bacterium]
MEINISTIARQNPWWADIKKISEDYHLSLFEEAKVKWYPKLLSEFNFSKGLVYVLRGPRQTGKTTLSKLLIRNLLLDKKVNPKAVFYFACDQGGAKDEHSLREVFETYLEWVMDSLSERLFYVFLDEVTYTKNWATGIKIIADKGLLRNTVVIATGSSSLDLRHGGERMPGRRGKDIGLDKIMLPMNFREFINNVSADLAKKIPQIDIFNPADVYKGMREASIYEKEIMKLFRKYLFSGGFPRAVSSLFSENKISKDVYDIYRQAVIGDIIKAGKQEIYFRQIAAAVLNKRTNPFDWHDITRETDIGSHNTVSNYILDIEQLFVWDVFYHPKSLNDKRIAFKKRKKVYFKDPFIFHTLRSWCEGIPDEWLASQEYIENPQTLGFLVEAVVGSYLKSRFKEVFYWRKDSEDEIDFIVRELAHRQIYLEVKYQSRISSFDLKHLKKAGKGILLSKNTLDISSDGKIAIVPATCFLSAVS